MAVPLGQNRIADFRGPSRPADARLRPDERTVAALCEVGRGPIRGGTVGGLVHKGFKTSGQHPEWWRLTRPGSGRGDDPEPKRYGYGRGVQLRRDRAQADQPEHQGADGEQHRGDAAGALLRRARSSQGGAGKEAVLDRALEQAHLRRHGPADLRVRGTIPAHVVLESAHRDVQLLGDVVRSRPVDEAGQHPRLLRAQACVPDRRVGLDGVRHSPVTTGRLAEASSIACGRVESGSDLRTTRARSSAARAAPGTGFRRS